MTTPATSGVTVVVCCHNSANLLPDTLKHLARQQVPESVPWEIVVIDNASTDATADVARDVWREHGGDTRMRVVPEPRPGLVFAREAGAESASYEYVVYCDDDNWLAPDYVRRVHEILGDRSDVGVLGGCGEPVFATQRPEWFDRYPQYYATGPQADASGDVTDTKGFVYGAGFAVRRSVWLSVLRLEYQSSMSAFERGSNDIELCYLMRLAGTRIYYDERLRFRHYLPPFRLTWRYLLDLVENAHLTGVYMAAYGHVLRSSDGDEAYRPPPRWYWLRRIASLAPSWLRTSLAVARHRGEAHHPAQLRERRLRGEVMGWLRMRNGYRELCNQIEGVRRTLREG